MNDRITEIIKSMGIISESEHYEIAEKVIRECAILSRNLSPHGELTEKAILDHFGISNSQETVSDFLDEDEDYSVEDLFTFSNGYDPIYKKYENEENNDDHS